MMGCMLTILCDPTTVKFVGRRCLFCR